MIKIIKKSVLFFVLIVSVAILTACHKPDKLTKELALKTLNSSDTYANYSVVITTNNPFAYAKEPEGWNCDDKKQLIDTGIVTCETAGRSAVYLEFTNEGKKLLVGTLKGNSTFRTAQVIAAIRNAISVESIEFTDKTHAFVHYTSSYTEYTPFATAEVKTLVPLNEPLQSTAEFALQDRTWILQ